MKIGIPQSLVYFKRPIFWKSFFESLGMEVVLSPKTNKEIVERGVKVADPETCFSLKVYWGHLLWLENKCDLIFVPMMKTDKEKLEYCPKFFGLPDLAQILVKTPILSETFDEKKEKFSSTMERLGRRLKKDSRAVKEASRIAFLKEKESEATDFLEKIESKKLKIVLISHPYNLHDEYFNCGIKDKLEKLGAETIFIDQIPVKNENSTTEKEGYPDFHWEFAKEIMDKIKEVLKYKINGVIELSSFSCGCDAVLKEFVEREFKSRGIPFLYIILDEQTGEAGFQTRLEAFTDTLK